VTERGMTEPAGWGTRDGRVVTFAWNLATRYALIAIQVLLGIVVLPFNLKYLGESDYGLLTLVGAVTTYFTVLELGYGGAVVKFVAEYRARRDWQALNETLSTMFFVFSGMGACVYLVAIAVSFFLPQIFNLEPGQVRTSQVVLLIFAVNVALFFVFSVFGGVINGFELYYVNNIVGGLSNIAAAVVNIWIVWMGFGLVPMVVATTATRIIPFWIYRRNAYKAFPQLDISWANVRRERLRQLTGFSVYFAVIDWSARLTYTTDIFILGMFTNTAGVAVYAIAQRLAEALLRLTNQLHTFLFPAVVAHAVEGGMANQRSLFVRATRFQLAVSVAMCGSVAAVAPVLIEAWVGPGYNTSAVVLQLLALIVVLRTLMAMPSTVLKGTGHHRFVAVASAWCAVASLLLSIAAVKLFGIFGVAWGALIPAFVLAALVVFPRTCRVVHLSTWSGYRDIVWPAVWPAVVTAALLSTGSPLMPVRLTAVLPALALGALVYALLFIAFGLDREERQWFTAAGRRILRLPADGYRQPAPETR
jgi:O-antigen/teichoic acid export membrane protein